MVKTIIEERVNMNLEQREELFNQLVSAIQICVYKIAELRCDNEYCIEQGEEDSEWVEENNEMIEEQRREFKEYKRQLKELLVG